MSALAAEVKRRFPDTPLGINVLRNDGLSALAIAHAVGAEYIRVNVLCGARLAVLPRHQADGLRPVIKVVLGRAGAGGVQRRGFDLVLPECRLQPLEHLGAQVLRGRLAGRQAQVVNLFHGCLGVLADADNQPQTHAFFSRRRRA